jgi:hypothetical protein
MEKVASILLLSCISLTASPVTIHFTGEVGSRYKASADITLPPEISFRAPVSGSFTYDLDLVESNNTSGLNWLARYNLLTQAASLEMQIADLTWHFSADPNDTPGTGAEQVNSFYVQYLHTTKPDQLSWRFWDQAPAQDNFPFLPDGGTGRLIMYVTDDEPASSELQDLSTPSSVPGSWTWEGDIAYLDNNGSLTFGFRFSMNLFIVDPGPTRINQWSRLANGDLQLVFTAGDGLSYDLENSSDLQNWSSVQSIGTSSGETTVTITPGSGAQFYRLIGTNP